MNLSPQFVGNTPVGFDVYRPMLDAFYASLKAVSPQQRRDIRRHGALRRADACQGTYLSANAAADLLARAALPRRRKAKKKKKKEEESVRERRASRAAPRRASTSPLTTRSTSARPTRHAINPEDASTPDIGRLRTVLRKGGSGNKPIWNTEIWWNSNPPGRGVSLKTQARYLSQSFYLLWKQGVQAVFWFELHDACRTVATRSRPAALFSGLHAQARPPGIPVPVRSGAAEQDARAGLGNGTRERGRSRSGDRQGETLPQDQEVESGRQPRLRRDHAAAARATSKPTRARTRA